MTRVLTGTVVDWWTVDEPTNRDVHRKSAIWGGSVQRIYAGRYWKISNAKSDVWVRRVECFERELCCTFTHGTEDVRMFGMLADIYDWSFCRGVPRARNPPTPRVSRDFPLDEACFTGWRSHDTLMLRQATRETPFLDVEVSGSRRCRRASFEVRELTEPTWKSPSPAPHGDRFADPWNTIVTNRLPCLPVIGPLPFHCTIQYTLHINVNEWCSTTYLFSCTSDQYLFTERRALQRVNKRPWKGT